MEVLIAEKPFTVYDEIICNTFLCHFLLWFNYCTIIFGLWAALPSLAKNAVVTWFLCWKEIWNAFSCRNQGSCKNSLCNTWNTLTDSNSWMLCVDSCRGACKLDLSQFSDFGIECTQVWKKFWRGTSKCERQVMKFCHIIFEYVN